MRRRCSACRSLADVPVAQAPNRAAPPPSSRQAAEVSRQTCNRHSGPSGERGAVYIVGEDGYDWSAVMKCPGGCGKMLEMNLLSDAVPAWRATEHENGSISLRPSVWLRAGCRCHFVLERGLIRWA